MKKIISILGSTGSIGLSTLRIIDKKKDYFKINLLSANTNYKIIIKQIKKYKPNYFFINDAQTYLKVKKKKIKKTKILNKIEFLKFNKKNDITISAISGLAGLAPTIKLTKLSKKVLIANKESIICGWRLLKNAATINNTKVISVDSEHYSILKLIENHKLYEIEKIFLTASGGPFLNYKSKRLKKITPKEALKHPKWKMGKKITIESATMMNKLFEVIEAQKLFNIPDSKIEIIVHPESLVHAIVKLNNGLIKFIYHETSMIIPLANAIFEGNLNIKNFFSEKKKYYKNKSNIKNLNFSSVDSKIFPVIKFKNRLNELPSTPIILNAANEILVDQFINKKIGFLAISKFIMRILNSKNYKKYAIKSPTSLKTINLVDEWAKQEIKKLIIKK